MCFARTGLAGWCSMDGDGEGRAEEGGAESALVGGGGGGGGARGRGGVILWGGRRGVAWGQRTTIPRTVFVVRRRGGVWGARKGGQEPCAMVALVEGGTVPHSSGQGVWRGAWGCRGG